MKKVTIVVPKSYANLSSIAGTFQVLTRANEYWQKQGKRAVLDIHIAGFISELKLDSGFFSIHPENIENISGTDLVIIPSVSHEYERVIAENKDLVEWIRHQYERGAEIASICTGAFLLASTGLLNGKSCSTHWNAAEAFRKMFPAVALYPDQLITIDKRMYTNGGAYSFLNLVLLLVESYFDRQTAIYCSKVFQVDINRHSQSPFYIFQAQKNHGDELVGKAQEFIEENSGSKISFEKLASQLAVSRRNFDRRFIRATGNTPLEYLQRVKVEIAKNTLEKGRKNVSEVMNEVGYSDDKAFREVFKRLTGLSPLDYKARFQKEAV